MGYVAAGALGWLLAAAVSAILALTIVAAIFAPDAVQRCETLDGAGEPIGPAVGSLGEVAGSGITRSELALVRSSRLASSTFASGLFTSTAYGPPWGGLQGPGVATAGGIRLDGGAPRKYLIATDPSVIGLGRWVYAWPNPFGWRGAFLAADTGGRIKGRRIDFYDWRGRAHQNRWNQQTTVRDRPFAPHTPSANDRVFVAEGAARVDAAAGQAVARQLTGQPVGFALVDDGGRVLASIAPNASNRSASITKAMVLIALTRNARTRPLSSRERRLAAAMIRRSDNDAANALVAQVGGEAIEALARHAGMTGFTLVSGKRSPRGFVLGDSRVTAVDQARLFARIDALTPARHRAFAMQLLESIEGAGRFGILAADLNAAIRSKGGWRPEDDGGWTVNQAAQVTVGGNVHGFAVILGKQQTFHAGAAAIASVARATFSRQATPDTASGCDHALPPSGETGERIAQIARRHLGRDGRRQHFAGFQPPSTQLQWCAWFSTNVWRIAGVPVEVDWFSGYHYRWARRNDTLFKDAGSPPRGTTPPVGSALMYGTGPQSPATSQHVNLVDTVNPDGTFMITGGNQDSSRVTRQGPCRMTTTDPARLRGPGCDTRSIYAIAAPTPPT